MDGDYDDDEVDMDGMRKAGQSSVARRGGLAIHTLCQPQA